MQLQDIIVEVRAPGYQRAGQILAADLDLKATVLFNNVGTWELTLAKTHPLAPILRTPGSGIIVTGPDGKVLLSGPTDAVAFTATPDDTDGTITFTGVTDDTLLAERLAYPDPAHIDVTQQTVAHDVRSGPAETLMHDYVRVNMGNLAPAGRSIPNLTFAPNSGRGPQVSKSARFDVLGSLLLDISANTKIGFQIRQGNQSNLEFSTFQTTDRSSNIRLSIQNGGMAGVKVTTKAPVLTRAILGGQGEQESRLFAEASNTFSLSAETEWGRRIEKFVNASSGGGGANNDELAQQGIEALADGGMTTRAFELVPSENTDMVFGKDWGLGDRVTVEVGDAYTNSLAAYVGGFALTATASEGFVFGVILADSLGPEKTAKQKLEDRLSYLERNDSGSGSTGGSTPTVVTFNFATAVTTWTCPHNLGATGVAVVTYDSSGTEVVGDVTYPDTNTVVVQWYYPTAGTCRITP